MDLAQIKELLGVLFLLLINIDFGNYFFLFISNDIL